MLGIERLQEAYFARVPRTTTAGITVPAIVDVPTGQVVTNDFAQITLDLSTEWTGVPPATARRSSTPSGCATRSTRSTELVFADVNNGVYRAGFAGTQEAYDEGLRPAVRPRSTGCRERLATQRYLVGDTITEADVRLFTTLAGSTPSTTATSSATGRS